jgi:hypothetical protein
VFALGLAVLQYLYRHEPKSLGFAGSLLKVINGDEENPDKIDKVVRKQLGYKPGTSTLFEAHLVMNLINRFLPTPQRIAQSSFIFSWDSLRDLVLEPF